VRKGAKKEKKRKRLSRERNDRTDGGRTGGEQHVDSLRDAAGFLGGDLDHVEGSVRVKVFERCCAGVNAWKATFQIAFADSRYAFFVGRLDVFLGSRTQASHS
jgi:hypothetical protein